MSNTEALVWGLGSSAASQHQYVSFSRTALKVTWCCLKVIDAVTTVLTSVFITAATHIATTISTASPTEQLQGP